MLHLQQYVCGGQGRWGSSAALGRVQKNRQPSCNPVGLCTGGFCTSVGVAMTQMHCGCGGNWGRQRNPHPGKAAAAGSALVHITHAVDEKLMLCVPAHTAIPMKVQ